MSENSRLGRCETCRFWRSAPEILRERLSPGASPAEEAAAQANIRAELSCGLLSPSTSHQRGYCLLAEQATGNAPHYAINLGTDEPARAITSHDYGCVNHEARPHLTLNNPDLNFLANFSIRRCASCQHWSSADNEARALFAMHQYQGEFARQEDCEHEAFAKLSPPPFSPADGGRRGWCKLAAVNDDVTAKVLAFDPYHATVGALITDREFACTLHADAADPNIKTSPDYFWLANRDRAYIWGAQARIDELYWHHGDLGQILNPDNINSPMNELNPRAYANPQNLAYNPNPAFAAYRVNPSLVNSITKANPTPNLEGAKASQRAEASPATGPEAPRPAEKKASTRAVERATWQFTHASRAGRGPKGGAEDGPSEERPAMKIERKKAAADRRNQPKPSGFKGDRRR